MKVSNVEGNEEVRNAMQGDNNVKVSPGAMRLSMAAEVRTKRHSGIHRDTIIKMAQKKPSLLLDSSPTMPNRFDVVPRGATPRGSIGAGSSRGSIIGGTPKRGSITARGSITSSTRTGATSHLAAPRGSITARGSITSNSSRTGATGVSSHLSNLATPKGSVTARGAGGDAALVVPPSQSASASGRGSFSARGSVRSQMQARRQIQSDLANMKQHKQNRQL